MQLGLLANNGDGQCFCSILTKNALFSLPCLTFTLTVYLVVAVEEISW